MEIYGIKFIGLSPENGRKLLLTLAFILAVLLLRPAVNALEKMRGRYYVHVGDLKPRVFMRLTDNRLELSARFIARDHGVREMKDTMSREILEAFDEAGVGIASATYDIVGLPPLKVEAVNVGGAGQAPRREANEQGGTV